ncbi:MAG: SDR family oxidoreductase, partial [Burkholderiaceae bacterium]|nr:SDR family oxidoreductase [Burkholderiaceae bacterium]
AADIDAARAQATAQTITRTGAQAWSYAIDVTQRDAVRALAAQMVQQHGPIDILINNAGIAGRSAFDAEDQPAVWDRLLAVNLHGLFNVSHAFTPQLKTTRGCIVNMASIAAFVSGISTAGYIASKGAIRSLTQAMARDLAPAGVRVNAVAPGVMLTELVRPMRDVPGGLDWYTSRVPLGRCGEPEEVVGPIVFLCSPMASYVNGVVLPIDGGFLSF